MALHKTNCQSKQIFGMFIENISLDFTRMFFCEDMISARIYEILMNSYESSIIYGVLGQHLMTHRFQSQTYIKGCFNVLKIQSNQ